ncbi:DUF6364 family protein [Dyadobacter sp. CY345]|uniref:DUF6364 family protein n=1 Tax=Dyadobacter sp. CY345 TaxID=2909335 RepID=UPI001F1BED3A|nr:DUF6364 family protein [Dyadobacter sp. CY345]MCF2447511.1 DUF6364 family protein [Dyadobacter sp. CY345]
MSGTKLTLNIQDDVVSKAKIYAKQRNVSLSKIVEHYLNTLSEVNTEPGKVSPWVKELVAVKKPTKDFDHKEMYSFYVVEKYSEK